MVTKKATKKRRITFTIQADPGAVVYLAGSFNNWDPQVKKMIDKRGDGNFAGTLMLAPGTYEYKFVINGTWCLDNKNCEWAQNNLGTLNSVLTVEV